MLLEWSAPHVPVYTEVITEKHDEKKRSSRKVMLVYKTE
jgi:hypothetical protein